MNEKFMKIALDEAKKSGKDVPCGAVIVYNNKIIAKTHNQKEKKKCSLYHAEILAIKKASKKIKNFRLNDCEIYITKEPCLMCFGALLSARIGKIYFGAYDKKYSILDLKDKIKFNHNCEIVGGIMQENCEKLLSEFFENLRG